MLVPHREQCVLPIRKTNSDYTVRSVRNTCALNAKMDKVQNFSLNVKVIYIYIYIYIYVCVCSYY